MAESSSDWVDRFIAFLEGLEKSRNRGVLARLRRGLGKAPGTAAEMHPYIVPWTSGLSHWNEDACYVMASLFALHPGEGGKGNLGASFAALAWKEQKRQGLAERPESLERRFAALLNCCLEDLPGHLRQAIGLLKSKEVPVDWRQLLRDYRAWEWEGRHVQRQWARAFWGSAPAAAEAKNKEEAKESEEVNDEG